MLQRLVKNTLAVSIGLAFAANSANAFVVNETFSGSWAEPGSTNRGMVIDIVEDSPLAKDFSPVVIAYWYTYDSDGDPLWLLSSLPTPIDPDTNSATFDLLEFDNGAFAPSDTVSTSDTWGSATLTFNSCNDVSLTYEGPDGLAGTIEGLQNLTSEYCVVDEAFNSCPDFATPGAAGTCIISGEVTDDIVLTHETTWLIQGQFIVADGATVTIEPNTELVGGTLGDNDTFVVAHGGKLFAE